MNSTLRTELLTDPLGRGYASKTDQQCADDLNTVYRTRPRTNIPTWEVLEATIPAEYATLTAAEKQRYQIFISAGTLNPAGTNTRAAFSAMFAAGTTTRTNLLELASEPCSRAAELGIPRVKPGHVAEARS